MLSNFEKKNLQIALARNNMVIYGNAYDVVKCKKEVDFFSEKEIHENLDSIIVYEVKSSLIL